jgi:hypothetical protein
MRPPSQPWICWTGPANGRISGQTPAPLPFNAAKKFGHARTSNPLGIFVLRDNTIHSGDIAPLYIVGILPPASHSRGRGLVGYYVAPEVIRT